MPRENTTQGISFTPTLLTQAKTRAKEKGLSVSAYVQQLILSDLADDETRLDAASLARIKALVRRSAGALQNVISVGPLCVDTGRRQAAIGGVVLDLTAKEWCLLEHLALRAGTVVPRDALWQTCYDFNEEPNPNRIEAHLANLRRKLATAGAEDLIRTRRGQGYQLGGEA